MLYTQHFLLPLKISSRDMQNIYTGIHIFSSELYVNKSNINPYLVNRISWIWDVLKQVFR